MSHTGKASEKSCYFRGFAAFYFSLVDDKFPYFNTFPEGKIVFFSFLMAKYCCGSWLVKLPVTLTQQIFGGSEFCVSSVLSLQQHEDHLWKCKVLPLSWFMNFQGHTWKNLHAKNVEGKCRVSLSLAPKLKHSENNVNVILDLALWACVANSVWKSSFKPNLWNPRPGYRPYVTNWGNLNVAKFPIT